jgi:oligopeptidase B
MDTKNLQENAVTVGTDSPPQPPVAARKPVAHLLHRDLRIDDYAWLREKENPAVIQHLQAENAYTDALLKPTEAFQESLYNEMLSRIQQTDLSVPYRLRGYLYSIKTIEGQQYPLHLRRPVDNANAADQTLLDLNTLAQGHSFLGLGSFEVSDDNHLLAYSTDTTGFRQYTLHIKDFRTAELLAFRVERVTSAAWSADNRHLFYVVEDPITKRAHRLYRHALGDSAADDQLLYDESDERFHIDIGRSRSGAYLILIINSHTTSEIRFLSAANPLGEFQLIAPREDNHEYYVEHHPAFALGRGFLQESNLFLIRTNSGGRTFRLVAAPVSDPQRSNWRELIPNRPSVMLSAVDAFRSHLALFERENGLPFLRILPLDASSSDLLTSSYRIPFAEPAYNASPGSNPEFDQSHFRYSYESFVTPRSVFDFDIATRTSSLRKQQPVLGGYDRSLYIIERLHATASDGTQIPISFVSRKNAPRDNSAPLLLYGYGSYGLSMPVNFNSNRFSLLDRGVSYAIAHIRGGGELGKPWHDDGRMHNKLNTFTDFIAAAEFLIANRYTGAGKLFIQGGSAGGLLMGAVTNMRPIFFTP